MPLARTSALALLAPLALLTPRGTLAQRTTPASERPAGSVAELRFESAFRTQTLRAGESVVVLVGVLDETGRPASGKVEVDCDFGEIGPVAGAADGIYRAELTIPRELGGRKSILVLARAGAVSAEATLRLGPAEASQMRIAGPLDVLADGRTRARLDVSVEDAYGNRADEVPQARASRGVMLPAERVGPGRWRMEYLPDRTTDEVEDVLVVEVGALRRQHAIRLTTRRTWTAIAPWSGVALASGGSAFALGGGASLWRRVGAGQVGAVLDAAWWRLNEHSDLALPGGTVELDGDRSYLAATLSLSLGRRLGRHGFASLAAGGGVARVTSAQQLEGQPDVREAGFGPTATVAVGLGLRTPWGTPYLEARAFWIGDPGLATLSGATRPLLLTAGYRFRAR